MEKKMMINKQLSLKPQDVVVAVKISIQKATKFTYASLADELFMSVSEVHAGTKRCETCRLVIRTEEGLSTSRTSLIEFLTHGIQYVFPSVVGTITRGMPTGIAGPSLKSNFNIDNDLLPVWPDAEGQTRGISFLPLYPSLVKAAKVDAVLYDVMTLIDAIRGGAARERELAKTELVRQLR
jgi:hypothetical protein